MARVTMELPDDLITTLKINGVEIGESLRLEAAFSLCRQGKLSTSQAARLAGLTYVDFLEAAAKAKVELFSVDPEELAEEMSRGFTLGRQHFAN